MIPLKKKGIKNAVSKTGQMPTSEKEQTLVEVEVLQDGKSCKVNAKLLSSQDWTLGFNAARVVPVLDSCMRGLCTKPYPNHPKGCPNYGQRDICPPKAKLLPEVFDLEQPIWALWAEFNFASQVAKQRAIHPNWSERQLRNPRHWQGTVRKFLREAVAGWLEGVRYCIVGGRGVAFTTCPEGMGVNVTATMANIGVTLEWPPKKITRLVYFVGVSHETN